MTTKTIEGLHELLETRADSVVVPPTLARRVAPKAKGVRRRRRAATGLGGLGVATLVIVPLVFGWPGGGAGHTEPVNRGLVNRDGLPWAPSLPGLDLPEGAPLSGTYARGDVIVIDGREVVLDEPVGSFVAIPGGVLAETGRATGSVSSLATSLEMIRADGTIETIDDGFIAGSATSQQSDGSVMIAYGWLETATASAGEIRIRTLGSDRQERALPVTPAATVLSLEGGEALIGYLADPGGYRALLDVETGDEERVAVVDGPELRSPDGRSRPRTAPSTQPRSSSSGSTSRRAILPRDRPRSTS